MTPKEKIIKASQMGYFVDESGTPFSKRRELVPHYNNDGYKYMAVSINKKTSLISIHRMVAYQKFGDKIFDKNIHVRHLDGNRLNNSIGNIGIGTPSENRMDIPREIRVSIALKANNSKKNPIVTIEFVRQLLLEKKLGMTVGSIMKKHHITRGRFYYLTRYDPMAKNKQR